MTPEELDKMYDNLQDAPDLDSGIHGYFLTPRQGMNLIKEVRRLHKILMMGIGIDKSIEFICLNEKLKRAEEIIEKQTEVLKFYAENKDHCIDVDGGDKAREFLREKDSK